MKAFLAGFLHLTATLVGPDPNFPKPAIDRIRVVGDTVWFEGTRGFDTVSTRYCFVRRTATWCHLPRQRVDVAPIRALPRTPAESLGLVPGLRLLCRPLDDDPSSCREAYGVLSVDDGRVHWLVPHTSRAIRVTLQRAIELETDQLPEMTTSVTAYVADARSIWFGLGGAISEGDGAFGGLLRFDRERRTVETITHPKLASASVTALAIDGGVLWIGTMHPEEHGPYGSTGVLKRDLRTGRWTQLDAATTALPDNLVHTLAAAGGALYVATTDGLAVLDSKSGSWSVRYFRRTIIADSVVYALSTDRPADELYDETMYLVMDELRVTRRGAFVRAMREARHDYLARHTDSLVGSFVDVLSHPVLLPFLVEALENPDAQYLAVAALAATGDRRALPPLRDAFARSTNGRVSIAAAMARLGDSASLAWLHRELLSTQSSHHRDGIVTLLLRLRDTTSIEPIYTALVRAHDDNERQFFVRSLGAYRSIAVWRRMVDTGRQVPGLRRTLVEEADSLALDDPIVAAALGEWSLALIDSVRPGISPGRAFAVAARVRPREAVRTIMRAFAADERLAASAVPQLIMLTGVDSAPAVRPSVSDARIAWQFWTAWWRANSTSYTVVSREAGARAYRRWLDRVVARERVEYERSRPRRG